MSTDNKVCSFTIKSDQNRCSPLLVGKESTLAWRKTIKLYCNSGSFFAHRTGLIDQTTFKAYIWQIYNAVFLNGKASQNDISYIIGGMTSAGLALRSNGNAELGLKVDAVAQRLAADRSRFQEEMVTILSLLGYELTE